MTYTDFLKLVLSMREAQKKYFRLRKQSNLLAAKEIESQVDAEIKQQFSAPQTKAPNNLFFNADPVQKLQRPISPSGEELKRMGFAVEFRRMDPPWEPESGVREYFEVRARKEDVHCDGMLEVSKDFEQACAKLLSKVPLLQRKDGKSQADLGFNIDVRY